VDIPVVASGGVTTADDVRRLASWGWLAALSGGLCTKGN